MTVKEAIKQLEVQKIAYLNLFNKSEGKAAKNSDSGLLEEYYKLCIKSLDMGIQAFKKMEMLDNLKKEIADNAWDYIDAGQNKKCVFLDDVLTIIDNYYANWID